MVTLTELTPIQIAEQHYDKAGGNFLLSLEQCHEDNNGWVVDVPFSFGMGYFYEEDKSIILRVVYVSGDFRALLATSLNFNIDKIEFLRNFTGQVRRYDYNKFISRCR